MCRIYGHLNGDHHPDHRPDRLARTLDRLRHGGPDDQWVHTGQGWALGGARLAITDVDHGQQPYELPGITVVFNGEIYNHDELRDRLTGYGYRFPDRCDGSILPALYHRYGLDFTAHLDGMYAIAVVDHRAEPMLVLATDETGMKPLYHHRDDRGGLYFASEIPALCVLSGLRGSPWLPGLDAYLTTKAVFGEQTMFEEIQVLAPATTAVFSAGGGLRLVRRPARSPADGPRELDHAASAVRETLREQTHRLGQADVPVAVITSGGLDSGLVTTMFAETTPSSQGFHIAYRGRWPFDERRFARLVARRSGTALREIELDPADIPALLPEVVDHLGQPNADPITVSSFALFRAVRAAGFPVVLTGDAADEFFGGYDRIRAATEAGDDWADRYVAALAAVPAELRRRLYTDDYRAYLAVAGTEETRLRESLVRVAAATSRLAAVTELEVTARMPAYHLRRVDHLSMASAVEARLPFCQPALTRLALGLPEDLRVRGDAGKIALNAASAGLLPEPVRHRPKQPFTLPVAAMVAEGTALFDYFREVLSTDEIAAAGQLQPRAVDRLLTGHAAAPTATTALAIWSLAIHQLWRRRAFDGALDGTLGPAVSEVA